MVITKIKLRSDTSENWTKNNPFLEENEIGLETDTRKFKVGDGQHHWNDLPYYNDYVSECDHAGNSNKLGGRRPIEYGANDIVWSGSDLNSVVRSGFYRLEYDLQNAPPGVLSGQLIVSRGSAGNSVLQIASTPSSDRLYWRAGKPPEAGGDGSWGEWKVLYPQCSNPNDGEIDGGYSDTF